ncbi:MAG: cation:proton antiporter [Planctomycetota bacterium]
MLASAQSLHFLTLAALVIGLGIGVQWLAARLRLPALLLLIACGLTLGPGLGVLHPDELLGDLLRPLVSLSVAIILFEGGLTLRFEEARRAGPVLWRLIVVGLFVGFWAVTFWGIGLAGLSLPTAAVLGAILVVTGPTVILPMLRTARIAMRPATLLRWEGIVNDPFGALLAVLVFQLIVADPALRGHVPELLGTLALHGVAAVALGGGVGYLLSLALRAHTVPSTLESPVMLAAALVVHATAEHIGEENGLLAVTVMGLVLANVKEAAIADILHFKEQIGVLLVSVLFVLLSARVTVADMQALIGPPGILVLGIVFVIRPLVVAIATWRTDLPLRERILVGWIAPRGVVAAAVAGAFAERLREAGHEDAQLLVPIVFGVIVTTVLLQGITIAPLARKLDLGVKPGTGILIVGATRWATALAMALEKTGAYVVVADTAYHRISRARRNGLTAHFGDVLSEEAELDLPRERLSWVLGATDDDAYNALVCAHFARELGRQNVLRLTPEVGEERRESVHRLVGRTPWTVHGTFRALASAYWSDEQFKSTRLTAEFDWAKFSIQNPEAAVLFAVVDGRIRPVEGSEVPPVGAHVVWYLMHSPRSDQESLAHERASAVARGRSTT